MEFADWLSRLGDAGILVAVPEIADYEVRRELLRLGATSSVARLNALRGASPYEPITTGIMHRAAELWAESRRKGLPRADRHALDGDSVLAATVESIARRGHEVTLATSNARHFAGIVPALPWQEILP